MPPWYRGAFSPRPHRPIIGLRHEHSVVRCRRNSDSRRRHSGFNGLMGRLEQKVAIVTGAAKGLGRATAMLFAAEGAIVVLSDFDAENGNAAATAIGARAQFQLHDVTLDADWERVVGETVQAFGRVDI